MPTIVFTYLFWAFIVRTVACCVRKCDQRVAERFQKQTFIENKYESNFYSCVDFRTLLLELDSAFDLKKAIETKFIYKLPQKSVESFLRGINQKIKDIEDAIKVIAN